MELHGVQKAFHNSHLGEEKHQMLNLNRRLETYLSRVKLLEGENALLAKEIQALRGSNQGASTRRMGLEKELCQARLEVDAAWRDRVHTELEVGKLTEELQTLDLQRQREAQAHVEAKTKLERSKKELEEEQRAQIWLREKVSQLEHEMRHLIQTHQEDVAHLEAKWIQSRATVPHTLARRGNQTPNLQELGQEFSQTATRAWQEAAEAYQGQLARLEESLNQARSRLTQVGQEKSESQLRLQALEKEHASAQDIRLHLEKTAAQQGHQYSQEIQQLQEHLGGLEAEREELGLQIDGLVLENRGLLQAKMSLGLEVATYRALLDSESLGGDISLANQPRNISITDVVFSPRGVKGYYQTQLSDSLKTTSLSSVRGATGTGPRAITATPLWSRKPATEAAQIPIKPAYEDTIESQETPYPKILQDGSVENFRPQEVNEKVTYAEPLSPPSEQETLAESTSGDKEGEEVWNDVGAEPPEERPDVESVVSHQVESGLGAEPPFKDETNQHQFTTSDLTPFHVSMAEERSGFPDESDKDVHFEIPAEKEDMQEPHAPKDAWVEKECMGKGVEHVQEDTSDSETEAVLEPNFESRTSSPLSEYEPEESQFNKDFSQDETILKEDAGEIRQEISRSVEGPNETDVEDKLYPDGEEMDTWDSVIERKADLKTDDGIKKDEDKRQHAEPEEDISSREQEHERREIKEDIQQDDNVATSTMDTRVDDDAGQHAALDQEHALLPDEEVDEDEEEDSQNVSVSWRTELESDSYAQDNTLADTRPLIRYKSDEADANTQASHVDESESSEGEQEKKTGETGAGTWNEGKSKRFGTMEDLCEEVEEEALDEEYDLGYTHTEDRGVGQGMTVSEHTVLVNDAEPMVRKVSEEPLDVETVEPMEPTNVDYDEELETDRLVEQELENIAINSYSAHFAQQQVSEGEEMLQLQGQKSVEEMTRQEDTSSCAEPEERVTREELHEASVTAMNDRPRENPHFSDSFEEVQHQDQEAIDAPEKREEEEEHNTSTVTHGADVTEDQFGFGDFISRPDMEDSDGPNSALQVTADQQNLAVHTEVEDVSPVEASGVSQEHLTEDVAACQEVPETAEWEVLENPSEDFEIRDKNEDNETCDKVPGSYFHSDEGVVTRQEELLEISPDSVPDENDIFVVKDSTELLNTNGKDNSLLGFFSSGVKSDFWSSSLETGATCQPDDACNEAAEQTNQNLGFADNLVWGNSENPNVVNRNSRVDFDSSKALSTKKEQVHPEVKLCRSVVEGELVHSEESEVEGESWSSGEEPI